MIKSNWKKEIERLERVNSHMVETIAESTRLIQIYKEELSIVVENCKHFEETLKLKYDKEDIACAFSKRVSSQLITFQNVENSVIVFDRINELVDDFSDQFKNTTMEEQIRTLKSIHHIGVNRSSKMLRQIEVEDCPGKKRCFSNKLQSAVFEEKVDPLGEFDQE